MANSTIEKLIEAGAQFTELTKKQAEDVVGRLVKAGDIQRQEAERLVQLLVDRGRETSERISEAVQAEVARQTAWVADRFDELEGQFESLGERIGATTGPAKTAAPAKKASARKAAPKRKAGAKKAAAKKKAGAKKAAARKKAGAKKAAAKKKAGAKKAASSGVRKISTSRPS